MVQEWESDGSVVRWVAVHCFKYELLMLFNSSHTNFVYAESFTFVKSEYSCVMQWEVY